MRWLVTNSGNGAINLAQVRRWNALSDGSVDVLLVGDSTAVNVPGVGTDQASATEAMRRITQAVDPADY
jgi:hypothetical protein